MRADRFIAEDVDARQVLGGVAVLVALLAAGVLVSGRLGWVLENPVAVRSVVRGYGPLAPVVFVLLQAAQVVVAPVPGHVLAFAAGYLFGPVLGFVYSVVGAALGTYVATGLARRFGRPWVERVVATEVLERFDEILDRYGLLGVFLVFLLPGFPDDVVCLVAGVSPLNVRRVVAVSVVGRAPGYLVLVLSGAGVAEGWFTEVGVLLGVVTVVTLVLLWRRRALLAWLERRTGTSATA